ncbi:MAG: GatB/YqeY domain-containing protein [Candidatus Kapaibacteriales bacterium]
MDLKAKITEGMKSAMKSGNKLELETFRSIRASILEFEKSGAGRELNSDDEISILNKAAKKRKDAISMYEDAGRDELADKEKEELRIIEDFLPKQMSDEELKQVIDKIIADNGFNSGQDMGKAMGKAMPITKGKADGKRVQEMVKSRLGG